MVHGHYLPALPLVWPKFADFFCIHLVTALARYRAASEPPVLRRSMQLAFQRRWWSLLSVALHNSIATALDPTLDIAEGTFPVASAIDVWVRDPPAVSSLPARGA